MTASGWHPAELWPQPSSSVFDDSDAMYRPKEREDVDGGWGVWDKAAERWVDHRRLTEVQAIRQAMRANDANDAAENATWN